MREFFQSVRRSGVVAAASIKSAVWQKYILGLLLCGLVSMAGVHALSIFNFGENEARFIIDLGLALMTVSGCVFTIVTGAFLFYEEIEGGTALMIFARPVARYEWLLGKLLAVSVLGGMFCAAMTLVLHLGLWTRGLGSFENIPFLATAGFLQWLKLTVLSALVLFFSACCRGLLSAIMVSMAAAFVCHWHGLVASLYARSDSFLVRGTARIISALVPDFTRFDPAQNLSGLASAIQHAAVFTVFLTLAGFYAFQKKAL